jgi:hypothetical protein
VIEEGKAIEVRDLQYEKELFPREVIEVDKVIVVRDVQ